MKWVFPSASQQKNGKNIAELTASVQNLESEMKWQWTLYPPQLSLLKYFKYLHIFKKLNESKMLKFRIDQCFILLNHVTPRK